MFIKLKKLFVLSCFFLLSSFYSSLSWGSMPWLFNTNLGYGKFMAVADEDSSSIIRVALGKYLTQAIGAEFGVETGKTMILQPHFPNNPDDVRLTGTVNTFLDLLGTYTIPVISKFQAIVKAGVAYRTIDFSHQELKEITKVDPEIQVGVSYAINDTSSVGITYQAIFGKKIQIENPTDIPQGVPSEQVIFLGLSMRV